MPLVKLQRESNFLHPFYHFLSAAPPAAQSGRDSFHIHAKIQKPQRLHVPTAEWRPRPAFPPFASIDRMFSTRSAGACLKSEY